MKISRKHLRRIIREELYLNSPVTQLIQEAWYDDLMDNIEEYGSDVYEVVVEIPMKAWSEPEKTVVAFAEEGSEAVEEVLDDVQTWMKDNADIMSQVSLILKALGAASAFFPGGQAAVGPAFAAAQVADLASAYGNFMDKKYLEGFFDIIAAITAIPGTAMFKLYRALVKLGPSGRLVRKSAPKKFVSTAQALVDGIISFIAWASANIADIVSKVSEDEADRSEIESQFNKAKDEIEGELQSISDSLGSDPISSTGERVLSSEEIRDKYFNPNSDFFNESRNIKISQRALRKIIRESL
jgi:hypothetical protein